MLDTDTRAAILTLASRGASSRQIAAALGISRNSVKKVLRSGQIEVPALSRPEQLNVHLARIRTLHHSCKGNMVRVHEELAAEGVDVRYSTLTGFCRRHGIGVKPKKRVGQYHFEPGEEMQHDTSPHAVKIGGRVRTLQCASLVLCFSRKLYAQLYPRWTRFEARVFLNEAIEYLGGAAEKCMLDNSTVIMIGGTGRNAVPAPAMKAFSDRFGFEFVAHMVGDADRSGRVERPFHYIENNFYPGRTFCDLADLNAQLRVWCETNDRRVRKRLGASPLELFATEAPTLKALPLHIPEIYDLHQRRVDVEGYVNLHTNRYSVDTELIGRQVEIRESFERVRIFDGHRLVEEHAKAEHGARRRLTLQEHLGQGRDHRKPRPPSEVELLLRGQAPQLDALIDALQKRHKGRAARAVQRLHRLWRDYPTDALCAAIGDALEYRLCDLERIERMILRRIAGDFFKLPTDEEDGNGR